MVPLGQGGTFIAVFVSAEDPSSEALLGAYKDEVARRGSPFVLAISDLVDPATIPVVLLLVPRASRDKVMAGFEPPMTELPTEQIVTNIGRSHRRCGTGIHPDNIALGFDIAAQCKRAETAHLA